MQLLEFVLKNSCIANKQEHYQQMFSSMSCKCHNPLPGDGVYRGRAICTAAECLQGLVG